MPYMITSYLGLFALIGINTVLVREFKKIAINPCIYRTSVPSVALW